MKRIILFLVIIFMVISLTAQTVKDTSSIKSIKRNTIFTDIGVGPLAGFCNTINYDRILLKYKKLKVSGRIGIICPLSSGEVFDTFLLPVELNFIYGKKHNLETGTGIAYASVLNHSYGSSIFTTIRILCYRFQKPNGGFFFRFNLINLYFKVIDFKNEILFNPNEVSANLGFSFGYTFKNNNKN